MGLLSNSGQPERKFMQTFVLAPEGSVPNKFYVHNDMFRYEDEVFGDSEPELDEESEDEVEEEQEERQPSPEPVQENANSTYYDAHPVTNGIEEPLEESSHDPEPEPESETKTEELKPQAEEKSLEELEEKSTTPPPSEPAALPQEPPKAFSWASVTSKNLPPSGTVSSSGIPPHVKAPVSQPRVDAKPEVQSQPPRVREQRPRERPGFPPRGPRPGRGDMEQNDSDNRRIIRYPDSHQLFVGNLPHDIDENELKEFFMSFGNVVELRINTKGVGGKLPNFGFVVFDDSEPALRSSARNGKEVRNRGRAEPPRGGARAPPRPGPAGWDISRSPRSYKTAAFALLVATRGVCDPLRAEAAGAPGGKVPTNFRP
nr:ras GTPase-activating protein-binding protein 2 [Peromyscus maniculatus bairdii]